MRSLLLLLLLFSSYLSIACSCVDNDSIGADFAFAGVVFVGHVIDVKLYPNEKFTQIAEDHYKINSQTQMTTFAVQQLLKSKQTISPDTIVVFTQTESTSCGYIFQMGKSFVVYADRCPFHHDFVEYQQEFMQRPYYQTSYCHRTTPCVSKELSLSKERELL